MAEEGGLVGCAVSGFMLLALATSFIGTSVGERTFEFNL